MVVVERVRGVWKKMGRGRTAKRKDGWWELVRGEGGGGVGGWLEEVGVGRRSSWRVERSRLQFGNMAAANSPLGGPHVIVTAARAIDQFCSWHTGAPLRQSGWHSSYLL